jgi:penicillin-insensitive murein DD-endopeptidase
MRISVWAALLILGAGAAMAQNNRPAKELFGSVGVPAELAPRAIGSYAKGCLAGAVQLPIDGPTWQVMRLSRNRNWGHPVLVEYLKQLSIDAAKDGWPGLLIGDLAQPRGGPMLTGHASHQIGLDADVWLIPMPDYKLSVEEREEKPAISMLMTGRLQVDLSKWTDLQPIVLKRAASYPEVGRIFVSAAIKQKLCETAGNDRAWLRKIRPWFGHDAHFHVRLNCPAGMAGCASQAPVGPGDGCNELAEWLKPTPPPKPGPDRPTPYKPPPEMTLADLPEACAGVLNAGFAPGQAAAFGMPMPRLRPREN